jgi:hypothetical protein
MLLIAQKLSCWGDEINFLVGFRNARISRCLAKEMTEEMLKLLVFTKRQIKEITL